MALTRRDLLRITGGLGFAGLVPRISACGPEGLPAYVWDGPAGPDTLFAHGVASGDPLADAVILWTRVSSDTRGPVDVFVEVAEDPDFARRVAAQWTQALRARDRTVKVDVDGLAPGRTYFYRFWAEGVASPVGRTRTAPEGEPERLRFAICSCAKFENGWFHPYRHLAARPDLDLVLHLGDYLYEYGGSSQGRALLDPPHEIVTLDDYRRRHAHYRTDPDLQEVHRQHPMVCTWDDHETANNSWSGGADNHTEGVEGSWVERKDAGRQAYLEWLPVREEVPGVLYRHLLFGDLAEVIVLDTRIVGRDLQTNEIDVLWSDDRQLLGRDQEAWAFERIASTRARWLLVAQQVVMARWTPGGEGFIALNPDAWDGYPRARERFLQAVEDAGIGGLLVLTGDVHASFANDLAVDFEAYDPDTRDGCLGVEAVTPGVASSGADLGGIEQILIDGNPHIRWADTLHRGCVTFDLTHDRVQADWWHVPVGGSEAPDPVDLVPVVSFVSRHGDPGWRPVSTPVAPRADAPPLAP